MKKEPFSISNKLQSDYAKNHMSHPYSSAIQKITKYDLSNPTPTKITTSGSVHDILLSHNPNPNPNPYPNPYPHRFQIKHTNDDP